MKKILLFTGALLLMASGFTSCELDSCKVCKKVYYVNNQYDHEDSSQEYCGAALIVIENTADIVNGNSRITWECK